MFSNLTNTKTVPKPLESINRGVFIVIKGWESKFPFTKVKLLPTP
jgi:hypothetical protein